MSSNSPAVTIGIVAIFPLALILFATLPARRAAIATMLAGWCFMPQAAIVIIGFPELDRLSAPGLAILLCILIFDSGPLLAFRPTRWDVPMIVFCLLPIPTALSVGLGLWPGISTASTTVVAYGIPYFIGRLYLTDAQGLKDLAVGIAVAGLVYVPPCLLEMRLSPQLHYWVYGFSPTRMVHLKRYGGYKPLVFMDNGVELGFWLVLATVVAAWTVRSKPKIAGVPSTVALLALVGTTILCRSVGAVALLAVAYACQLWIRYVRTWTPVWLIILAIPTYLGLRVAGVIEMERVGSLAEQVLDEQRTTSLVFRLKNEDLVIGRALERPLLGWGGGQSVMVDPVTGRRLTIVDGLWIIMLGDRGLMGLLAFLAVGLIPAALFLASTPCRYALHPMVAPAVGLMMATLLFMMDAIPNASINPMTSMLWGAFCCRMRWSFRGGAPQPRPTVVVGPGPTRPRAGGDGPERGVSSPGGPTGRPSVE